MPPIRAPLLDLLELGVTVEPDPLLDPPAAVAVEPGEVAVPTGLGLPPLDAAEPPPVATATVILSADETKPCRKPRKSKLTGQTKENSAYLKQSHLMQQLFLPPHCSKNQKPQEH